MRSTPALVSLSALALACWLIAASPAVAQSPRFTHEVMAVLSKSGCNQGTCHGNLNGKNGFKLSLRGDDPDFDRLSLTRDTLGRRINPLRPAQSLLLLKATARVPHEGGQRFGVDSPEYRIVWRWLAAGATPDPVDLPVLRRISVEPTEQVLVEPAERTQLRVRAFFDDGSDRDVTALCVFEPANSVVSVSPKGEARRQEWGEATILVRYLDRRATVQLAFVPARPEFAWQEPPASNAIDRLVLAKLQRLRMQPSPTCSDAVFLRRAYLDVLGILPTVAETRSFLSDTHADKRGLLIEQLLSRPEYADFWALKWSDLLRNEEKTLDRKGVLIYHRWLRQCVAEGKPLNELARELIAGRGSTYSQPAANFYRALREPYVRAETVAQVFLGIRLQCARCHNHPFDRWTQNDYHSLAAFFPRVQYRILENNRRDRLDQHEFDGEQVVWLDRAGEVIHPRTGLPLSPRFPGAPDPELPADADRLQALADWIARPNNPFFARTQVNRVWYHLLGRGIVEPNDDFRLTNPPANDALLEALRRDFVSHQFDLRHLVKRIMNSRAYQASALPTATNRDDEANCARAQVRPLQAEQHLDALAQVTEVPVKFNGYPLGLRAGQLPGVRAFRQREQPPSEGERFLKLFGKPERLLSCECERTSDTTLGQALQLISGELVNDMVTAPNNRLGRLLTAQLSNREIVEELYLAALCRFPSDPEKASALAFLDRATDRRSGLEDLLWGLINAKEFLLRQ